MSSRSVSVAAASDRPLSGEAGWERLSSLRPPADRDRFGIGVGQAGRAHERFVAVAGVTRHDHQAHIAFGGVDEIVVDVRLHLVEDDEVGIFAALDGPELAAPAGRLRRHGGNRLGKLPGRDRRACIACGERGDLELEQDIAAARWGPVAAEREGHAGVDERLDVERLAIEQQVAQWRPHHLAADRRIGGNILARQTGAVDRDQIRAEQPIALQQRELGAGAVVLAFGEMKEEPFAARDLGLEFRDLDRIVLEVGHHMMRRLQRRVVGLRNCAQCPDRAGAAEGAVMPCPEVTPPISSLTST